MKIPLGLEWPRHSDATECCIHRMSNLFIWVLLLQKQPLFPDKISKGFTCVNDWFELLSLVGCLQGSQRKSCSSIYLVLLTLFTWLPSCCWPCQTLLHKMSLMPSSRYQCSLQFHDLLCITFITCETQPGPVLWSITCCVMF